MTQRILRAMDNKYVNVIAHPTGRLIVQRNPYELILNIFNEARKRNVAMELNSAYDKLDLNDITFTDNGNKISYVVQNPMANIIFVPGGLVEPDSYKYLAASLATDGYNVTIVKVMFNLAILTPNKAIRYIDEDLDNIIIGHSLGGVVASMVAAKQDDIST